MSLWDYLNSNFTAALFGAFLGAGVAHLATVRGERKKELLGQIRSTDAAIALTFNVVWRSLALKQQNILETVGEYELRRNALVSTWIDMKRGLPPPGNEIRAELDLKRLDPLDIPADRLEAVVLEEVLVRGRVPQLAITIGQCLASMNQSIERRNELIAELKTSEAPEKEKVFRFFSLPHEGMLDTSFRDALQAMKRQNDDCIWFGLKLIRDLEKHAVVLRKRYERWRFWGRLPPAIPVDFARAEAEGLIPADASYSDWETSFFSVPVPSEGRWVKKAYLSWHRLMRWTPGWRRIRRWWLIRGLT